MQLLYRFMTDSEGIYRTPLGKVTEKMNPLHITMDAHIHVDSA